MLRIAVVDVSAEARSRIAREIGSLQDGTVPELSLLPRISVHQLSPEEVKFHGAPDLLIVGDELISQDIGVVGRLRSILPDTPIIIKLRRDQETLVLIEDLARLGADDTVSENIDPLSLCKKLILHCRRPKKGRTANLVLVDSAKGGTGITSIVAGLAEAAVLAGKKVAVVDLDSDTQDLSRFLQSRPFINENLELLVDGIRPITEEHVKQCLTSVWGEEEGLFCVSPCLMGDDSQGLTPLQTRNLISVLEIIDSMFDVVVVDVGSARGTLLRTLYRVADRVLLLVSNDPACLYATVSRMNTVRQWISPTAELVLVENLPTRNGLPREILTREINAATKIDDGKWFAKQIPSCRSASRWPGSGDTIFSRGKRSVATSLNSLAERAGIIEGSEATNIGSERVWAMFDTLREKLNRSLPEKTNAERASNSRFSGLKLIPMRKADKADRPSTIESAEAAFEKLAAKTSPKEAVSDSRISEAESLLKRANAK